MTDNSLMSFEAALGGNVLLPYTPDDVRKMRMFSEACAARDLHCYLHPTVSREVLEGGVTFFLLPSPERGAVAMVLKVAVGKTFFGKQKSACVPACKFDPISGVIGVQF